MADYETEESVGSEHLDRLSELPESLIHHILSFLTMRNVVKTMLLSKRWENLWTTLPCLHFAELMIEGEPILIRNFVDRALMLWKGTKLLRFKIEIFIEGRFGKSLAEAIDLWVRFAVLNNVQELDIGWSYVAESEHWVEGFNEEDAYIPPQCLNSCSSIKKLSLSRCNLEIRGSVAWNQLKSLKFGCYLPELMINRILLGTPQLEVFEFRAIESNRGLNISSTSLKILKYCKFPLGHEPSLNSELRICCPNLETLEISGISYHKYLFTDVSSLTDVTLDFYDLIVYGRDYIELFQERMRSIFSTFQHVERVALSYGCFEAIAASVKKNLFPPLPSVVFLKVGLRWIELAEMVLLLGIFPSLKMLAIDVTMYYPCSPYTSAEKYSELETSISRSSLPQLKIVEITSDFNYSAVFQLIEFLLKHGKILEKLVIRDRRLARSSHWHLLEVAQRLLRMPRSSPNAEVVFIIK